MSTTETPVWKGKPRLALIAGPTASGKTELGVQLAEALAAMGRTSAVINADSAQVYRDLRILSARPSEEEMRGVPHLLFGEWDGAQACSAADWARRAKEQIAELVARDTVPILVGGTGLYFKTLLEGIAPIPEIDPGIRASVRALPTSEAYEALQHEDRERADALAPGDSQRIARALEVVRSTGRTLGEWQASKVGGIADAITLHAAVLVPDRDWLYERCDRRFGSMIDEGAVEEVEALLARDLNPELPVMRAIGVPEIAEYLAGRLSMADAIINAQRATRNLAKRQYTWFRHQPPEDWKRIESFDDSFSDELALLFQS